MTRSVYRVARMEREFDVMGTNGSGRIGGYSEAKFDRLAKWEGTKAERRNNTRIDEV
jgi:hypothetical protein